MNLLLHLQNRMGQPARLLGVRLQQVICDALGGLRANAREPPQLIEEYLQAAVC